MSYENYKNCVEEVKDKNGKVIKYHDVVRTSRGEILLVGFGVNHHHKTKGLNAVNDFIGAHDWLDVYPDGELEILGNVDFLGGTAMNKQEKLLKFLESLTSGFRKLKLLIVVLTYGKNGASIKLIKWVGANGFRCL